MRRDVDERGIEIPDKNSRITRRGNKLRRFPQHSWIWFYVMSNHTRTKIYTVIVATSAVGLTLLSALFWQPSIDLSKLWLIPTLITLVALAGRFPFKVSPQGDATVLTVPLLVAVLLLHPVEAVVVGVAGSAVSEVLLRARPNVALFNVAANGLVAVLAGLVFWGLTSGTGTGFSTAPAIIYAVTAAFVLYVANLVILFGMITLVKGSGFWERWREAWSFEAILDISLLIFGLFAAQLVILAPWWLGVLTVAFIVTYYGYRRSVQQAVEKTRLAEELAQNLYQLKQTQAQLIQSAKLAGIGTLAAGLAHEINNPLTIITGRAELFLTKLKKQPEYGLSDNAVKDVEDIQEMGARISTIMKQLLSYSRRSEYLEEISLEAVIDDSTQLLRGKIENKDINLVREFQEIPPVRGIENQLQQVFINLISNAIDAVEVHGTVAVGCSVSGDTAVAYVKDTGSGISPEIRERLFEPFFTTKDIGEGTGLGLYICHKIVTEHHGDIELSSEEGAGTTVTVKLPVATSGKRSEGRHTTAA